jgi:hypothetical protein
MVKSAESAQTVTLEKPKLEMGREAFIKAVKKSRAEFQRGNYKRGSAADIMREALEKHH